jgi:hypothetical protein
VLTNKLARLRTLENERLEIFSESSKNVQQLRNEISDVEKQLRKTPLPKTNEIAMLKLQFTEEQLVEARKKHELGVIDPLELEKARAARDTARADLNGDVVEKARINLRLAQMQLDIAEKKRANGVANDYAEAKLARDIAAIQLREAEAGSAK